MSIFGNTLFAVALLMPLHAAADAGRDPSTGLRQLPYPVNAAPARYAHMGPTLVSNVRVVDGMGNPAIAGRDILLRDGRIAAIAATGTITAPEGAIVIDGRGMTALPGLMDLHVHFGGSDRFAGHKSPEAHTRSDIYRYKSYLYAYLYNGVTTVLDAGTVPTVGVGLKALIDEGYVLGPRYFWSGPILEGGIDNFGPGDYGLSDHQKPLLRSEDAAGIVEWLSAMDVDLIKLYRGTSLPMVERVAAEAHKRGMRVWMDAWERTGSGYFARHGRLDGWAHLNFWFDLDDVDIKRMSEADQFAVTTFYALNVFSGRVYEENPDYFDSPLLTNTLAPEFLEGMKAEMTDPLADMRAMIHHLAIADVQDLMGYEGQDPKTVMRKMSLIAGRNMKRMIDAGVLVGAGTDGGQGESTLTELELMVADAGITPLQAIQVATWNGARILGKEDEFGSLQVGLLGDLLLVEGKPDERISDIRNIRHVFKGGQLLDRASLERQWGY